MLMFMLVSIVAADVDARLDRCCCCCCLFSVISIQGGIILRGGGAAAAFGGEVSGWLRRGPPRGMYTTTREGEGGRGEREGGRGGERKTHFFAYRVISFSYYIVFPVCRFL